VEDRNGEIEPGYYNYAADEVGAARAETEQKRAEIIDSLRTSQCLNVHILEEDGQTLNATMILGVDGKGGDYEPAVFLTAAALSVIEDLAIVLERTEMEALVFLALIVKGRGDA
jgi:hypothetical protein